MILQIFIAAFLGFALFVEFNRKKNILEDSQLNYGFGCEEVVTVLDLRRA